MDYEFYFLNKNQVNLQLKAALKKILDIIKFPENNTIKCKEEYNI